MAEILPQSTTLPDVMEGSNVNETFRASLTEANATLVSLNIVEHRPNPGIIVEGANYKGTYDNVFLLGGDSLRYREGDDLKKAQRWEDLPDPKSADLYLWKAPAKMLETFTYTVEMIYSVQGESAGDPPVTPPPTEHKIRKTYSQTVFGDWSKWGNQLRAYVNAGK